MRGDALNYGKTFYYYKSQKVKAGGGGNFQSSLLEMAQVRIKTDSQHIIV